MKFEIRKDDLTRQYIIRLNGVYFAYTTAKTNGAFGAVREFFRKNKGVENFSIDLEALDKSD